MICGGVIANRAFEAEIGVLEDREADIDAIRTELYTFADKVQIAPTYREFVEMIRSAEFDAVSIDWYIGDHQKGREALVMVKRTQPDAGTVVFTRDPDRLVEASRFADAVLVKGDMERYRHLMVEAVRLGRVRRIVRELQRLKLDTDLSAKTFRHPLENGEEMAVRDTARNALASVLLNDQTAPALKELLVTRGWWRLMDTRSYAQLVTGEKLRVLATYTDISFFDVSKILDVPVDAIPGLFGGANCLSLGLEPSVDDRADQLLSVIGYLLRLSSYETELLPYFWRVKNFFSDCTQPPPWDRHGMESYLLVGPSSLAHSLEWIRSH